MPPETLRIVVTPHGTAWVARGEHCYAIGKSPDDALKRAKANYVQNVKTDRRWTGRVNVLKKILNQPPLSSHADWDQVVVEYELKQRNLS